MTRKHNVKVRFGIAVKKLGTVRKQNSEAVLLFLRKRVKLRLQFQLVFTENGAAVKAQIIKPRYADFIIAALERNRFALKNRNSVLGKSREKLLLFIFSLLMVARNIINRRNAAYFVNKADSGFVIRFAAVNQITRYDDYIRFKLRNPAGQRAVKVFIM